MILGMDWLFIHRTKVNYYENVIKCLDDDGEKRILQGKKKPTIMRMVIVMQTKHCHKKGCLFFAVHVSSDKGKEDEDDEVLRKCHVLRQFQDVFPAKIPKFPPHREVDFSTELVLSVAPTSRTPYMMSTP